MRAFGTLNETILLNAFSDNVSAQFERETFFSDGKGQCRAKLEVTFLIKCDAFHFPYPQFTHL